MISKYVTICSKRHLVRLFICLYCLYVLQYTGINVVYAAFVVGKMKFNMNIINKMSN